MLEYYRFKTIHDLFLKGRTDEACLQLKELQKRYVNVCEENFALTNRIREYEDILYLARNFIFDGNFYWLLTGSIKQGPFCPNCYNRDGQLVRITDMRPRRCAACGEVFELPQNVGKSQRGGAVRALEQSAAVGSLRAFAAVEQMAHSVLERQEVQTREARKAPLAAPAAGRNRVLRFDPEFRSKCKV